jgi:hypothetical protein
MVAPDASNTAPIPVASILESQPSALPEEREVSSPLRRLWPVQGNTRLILILAGIGAFCLLLCCGFNVIYFLAHLRSASSSPPTTQQQFDDLPGKQ